MWILTRGRRGITAVGGGVPLTPFSVLFNLQHMLLVRVILLP